jgi:hypothetical protein
MLYTFSSVLLNHNPGYGIAAHWSVALFVRVNSTKETSKEFFYRVDKVVNLFWMKNPNNIRFLHQQYQNEQFVTFKNGVASLKTLADATDTGCNVHTVISGLKNDSCNSNAQQILTNVFRIPAI